MNLILAYALVLSLIVVTAESAQQRNKNSSSSNNNNDKNNNNNNNNRAGGNGGAVATVPVPTSPNMRSPVQKLPRNQGSAPANTPAGFVNKDDYGSWGTSAAAAPPGLVEPQQCVPFNDPRITAYLNNPARFSYMNYDPRCDTNNCPSGCCRFYTNLLRCDYSNLFKQLPVSICFRGIAW